LFEGNIKGALNLDFNIQPTFFISNKQASLKRHSLEVIFSDIVTFL
jgi:hypothetical protein